MVDNELERSSPSAENPKGPRVTPAPPSRPFDDAALGDDPHPTVFLDDVHVTYRVFTDRRPAVRELITGKARRRAFREIYAVRGVTLSADSGDAIGLIGRNGSGKSTLLQSLAGLLPPTKGAAYASSQPSLLGVGAALQPNQSGRRNIELGLLALGLSQEETQQRIPAVISFAGLEDFGDLPLRTYSSGMRARIQFSIATEVRPEILLVDEALAVGDGVFKRRSERRIEELLSGAGTVFLVSHALNAVLDICTRVVWIDNGQVVADGEPDAVVDRYREFTEAQPD